MNITKKQSGTQITLSLDDSLDAITAPQLEAEINAIGTDIHQIDLDFEKLEYISSAGLRVLLNAQKMMEDRQGTLNVHHVCANIMEVFTMTGFDDILTIID